MSKPKKAPKKAAERISDDDALDALDDWEELFIAAISGGPYDRGSGHGAPTPEAFVDWCDSVATKALERLRQRGAR
jgi:hypothetical protein